MSDQEGNAPSDLPFINTAACRRFLLEYSASTRAHKKSRVSHDTLRTLNETVRVKMMEAVRTSPSKGKTL